MKSFQDRAKTNKDFKENAIKEWKYVHVNLHGCKLDIFSDDKGHNTNNDDKTYTGDTDKTFRGNTSGQCTKLEVKAGGFVHYVRATKPCMDIEHASHAHHSEYLKHKHNVSHRKNTFTKDAKPSR
jgi:hypothetical protein